jgi:D-alanyl-D-alanine carboxypeptidase
MKSCVGAALIGAAIIGTGTAARASNEALLLIEADTGKVLQAENATSPWYPASVSKIMTAYLTLKAIKAGRLTLDTPLTVSANAAAQQPSKMGFQPGTVVTVDNALKMLMVKSANDIAVVLAEGVAGSIEKFADEMNAMSARLGMTQSSWVNPNGLPADNQITSARDLAMLARAMLHEFPAYDSYWHIPAIKFGRRVIRNTNSLIDRYPGIDGMKTGFICASGFNVVATATRNNRRLIAVVLGAPSGAVRAAKAAHMMETAFNASGLNWLKPSLGTVDGLQPINTAPPNLREDMCGKHRKRPAAEEADEDVGEPTASSDDTQRNLFAANLAGAGPKPSSLIANWTPSAPPVEVWVGATRKAPPVPKAKTAAIAPKPDAAKPKPAAKPADKPAAKPAPKPTATAAVKPADKPAPKPAAAKPAATASDQTKTAPAAQ